MKQPLTTLLLIICMLFGSYSCEESTTLDQIQDELTTPDQEEEENEEEEDKNEEQEQEDNEGDSEEEDNNEDNEDNEEEEEEREPGLYTLTLFEPFSTADGYPVLEINPTVVENSALIVDVVEDYGAAGDGVTDDSSALQSAIEFVTSNTDGGIVYMPLGNYRLHDIELKSNVHLHVEAGSVISMEPSSSNTKLFLLGFYTYVNNVAIRGVNGRFTIDLTGMTGKPRTIRLNSVHNFLISDIDIKSNMVEFPVIGFGADSDSDPDIFGPTQGVIKNCSAYDCHYGYGLVQVQCANKVYFEELYGEGGVVLRFETGEDSMNEKQFGGVFDCRGQNISGINGNATVMISPHSMKNGVVQVDGITANSMGIGVRLDNGYEMTVNEGESDQYILPAGYYSDGCYISNVDATFGWDAQVKTKHLKYMPEWLLEYVPDPYSGTICQPSPSVCAILNVPNYNIGILGDITATGYTNEAIVSEEAARE